VTRRMPRGPRILRGLARANAIDWARNWRLRNKPVFDAMDARGAFLDSPPGGRSTSGH